MKLLHLDSSITGENSVSRSVSAAVVSQLKSAHPDLEVTYRDLVAHPIDHLTLPAMADTTYVDEFLATDIVVIGAGMYNFTLPSQLKAWVDRILLAGKTFKYGASGAEGLAGGKRVIVALARGGMYGEGSSAATMEHAETYLRGVFGFIGITDVEFIIAEGIAYGPEQRQAAHNGALEAAGKVLPFKAAA
jgi:FMN-dependent NADH-azoreductase